MSSPPPPRMVTCPPAVAAAVERRRTRNLRDAAGGQGARCPPTRGSMPHPPTHTQTHTRTRAWDFNALSTPRGYAHAHGAAGPPLSLFSGNLQEPSSDASPKTVLQVPAWKLSRNQGRSAPRELRDTKPRHQTSTPLPLDTNPRHHALGVKRTFRVAATSLPSPPLYPYPATVRYTYP